MVRLTGSGSPPTTSPHIQIELPEGSVPIGKNYLDTTQQEPISDYSGLNDGQIIASAKTQFLLQLRKNSPWFLNEEEAKLTEKSIEVAIKAHTGQKRASGIPYIVHPLEVASLVAAYGLMPAAVRAAILHDVIEDSGVSQEDLQNEFGVETAMLVAAVSKLKFTTSSREDRDAEALSRLLKTLEKSADAVVIKLLDRLHNSRSLINLNKSKAQRIVRQTLSIHVPLARRLGLFEVFQEMRDNCYRAQFPHRYKVLKDTIRKIDIEGEEQTVKTIESLQKVLSAWQYNIRIRKSERAIHEISNRMKTEGNGLREVLGGGNYEITLSEVVDPYQILGAIHSAFIPIQGSFKDYIAVPKGNGYQALHSSVLNRNGSAILIVIQSESMSIRGRLGFLDDNDSELHSRVISQLTDAASDHALGTAQFLQQLQSELTPRKIVASLSDRRYAIRLPAGATALDFAYEIDPEAAERVTLCRVDGAVVPLGTPLTHGVVVDFERGKTLQVEEGWLGMVKTPTARRLISRRLQMRSPSEARKLGIVALKQALKEFELTVNEISGITWRELFNHLEIKNLNLLIVGIGRTEISARLVARNIARHQRRNWWNNLIPFTKSVPQKVKLSQFSPAPCCLPLPGDSTVVILEDLQSDSKEALAHHVKCQRLKKLLAKKDGSKKKIPELMNVNLAGTVNNVYRSRLNIVLRDTIGSLADVTRTLTEENVNIRNLVTSHMGSPGHFSLEIEIGNLRLLESLIESMKKLEGVRTIKRLH